MMMSKLALLMGLTLMLVVPSHHQQVQDSDEPQVRFRSELFLNSNDLDTGLYEGEVIGKTRFDSLQIPDGKGTIFYFTTDKFGRKNYTGDWKNGTREGNGTTYWSDGSSYTGQYKDGLENGQGRVVYSNGNTLSAEFVDGRIQGHGVFRYTNGDQREGFFTDNELSGQVIFTRNDGVTFIEIWDKGDKISTGNGIGVGESVPVLTTPQPSSAEVAGGQPIVPGQSSADTNAIYKFQRGSDRKVSFTPQAEDKPPQNVENTEIVEETRQREEGFLRRIYSDVS